MKADDPDSHVTEMINNGNTWLTGKQHMKDAYCLPNETLKIIRAS